MAGAGVTAYVVTNLTLRQRLTPRRMLGSVYGLLRTVTRGAMPVGALLGGAVAGLAGARVTLALVGAGELAVALALVRARHLLVAPAENALPAVLPEPTDAPAG